MKKITVQHISEIMNRIAPRQLAEEWDNPGLLIGSFDSEVEKIFVCLDVTDETLNSAVNFGANLIIAHHPLIFRAVKNLPKKILGLELYYVLQGKAIVYEKNYGTTHFRNYESNCAASTC